MIVAQLPTSYINVVRVVSKQTAKSPVSLQNQDGKRTQFMPSQRHSRDRLLPTHQLLQKQRTACKQAAIHARVVRGAYKLGEQRQI